MSRALKSSKSTEKQLDDKCLILLACFLCEMMWQEMRDFHLVGSWRDGKLSIRYIKPSPPTACSRFEALFSLLITSTWHAIWKCVQWLSDTNKPGPTSYFLVNVNPTTAITSWPWPESSHDKGESWVEAFWTAFLILEDSARIITKSGSCCSIEFGLQLIQGAKGGINSFLEVCWGAVGVGGVGHDIPEEGVIVVTTTAVPARERWTHDLLSISRSNIFVQLCMFR